MCVHEIDQLLCDAVVHVEYLICIHALQNRNQCSKKVQILLNVERYARIRYIVKYAMTIVGVYRRKELQRAGDNAQTRHVGGALHLLYGQ